MKLVLQCTDKNQDGRIDLHEFIQSFTQEGGGAAAVVPAYMQRMNEDAEVGGIVAKDGVTELPSAHSPRPDAPALGDDTPADAALVAAHNEAEAALALARRLSEEAKLSPFPNDVSGVAFTEGMLRADFRRYDKDGSGAISRAEFRRAYKEMEWHGLEPSDREIDRLFSQFGGADDRLSYQEFCVLMLNRARM